MPALLPKIPLPVGDRWMHLKEVAGAFGVVPETVRVWCRCTPPRIPYSRPSLRRIVFRKSDVNKLLAELKMPLLP